MHTARQQRAFGSWWPASRSWGSTSSGRLPCAWAAPACPCRTGPPPRRLIRRAATRPAAAAAKPSGAVLVRLAEPALQQSAARRLRLLWRGPSTAAVPGRRRTTLLPCTRMWSGAFEGHHHPLFMSHPVPLHCSATMTAGHQSSGVLRGRPRRPRRIRQSLLVECQVVLQACTGFCIRVAMRRAPEGPTTPPSRSRSNPGPPAMQGMSPHPHNQVSALRPAS